MANSNTSVASTGAAAQQNNETGSVAQRASQASVRSQDLENASAASDAEQQELLSEVSDSEAESDVEEEEKKKGMSAGKIAGIVVGSTVAGSAVIFTGVTCAQVVSERNDEKFDVAAKGSFFKHFSAKARENCSKMCGCLTCSKDEAGKTTEELTFEQKRVALEAQKEFLQKKVAERQANAVVELAQISVMKALREAKEQGTGITNVHKSAFRTVEVKFVAKNDIAEGKDMKTVVEEAPVYVLKATKKYGGMHNSGKWSMTKEGEKEEIVIADYAQGQWDFSSKDKKHVTSEQAALIADIAEKASEALNKDLKEGEEAVKYCMVAADYDMQKAADLVKAPLKNAHEKQQQDKEKLRQVPTQGPLAEKNSKDTAKYDLSNVRKLSDLKKLEKKLAQDLKALSEKMPVGEDQQKFSEEEKEAIKSLNAQRKTLLRLQKEIELATTKAAAAEPKVTEEGADDDLPVVDDA